MVQIKVAATSNVGTSKGSGIGGCTCSKLRRLTRRVTAVYDRALSAAGMRVTQYSLLSNLRGLRGVPVSQLAEMLDMDRTTLTRNLRPLLDAGWVAVEPSAEDARVRLVHITAAGDAQWRLARTYWRHAQDEVNATIGAGNVTTLHNLLDRYVPLFRPADDEGDSQ
ncbi:MAG: MarR family transcriptional regulator [Proteobacteria bacterium]|nr:MAG: MarR family transcriptional regulator [Pseudomonadota bacterium]